MLIALPAQADADLVATEVGSSLFTGDYLLQVVGSFFLVICVLLAVMLLLKRFNTIGTSKGGTLKFSPVLHWVRGSARSSSRLVKSKYL